MSEIDREFMEVLANCAKAEGEVDYTDDGWMPPVGDYTCLLETFKTGTKERDGITHSWAKVVFRLDRTFEGWRSSFGDYFRFSPDPGDIPAKMTRKRFMALATCLAGRRIGTLEQAAAIIKEAEGKAAIRLRVKLWTSKRTKKRGRSVCDYLSRMDAPE